MYAGQLARRDFSFHQSAISFAESSIPMYSTAMTSPTQPEPEPPSMIAWEAIMGLDRLHRAAKIHKEPSRERRRILRVAGELIGTKSLAWIPTRRDDEVVFEGERLLSERDCAQLVEMLADRPRREETGYVLINDVREGRLGGAFPADFQPDRGPGR